MVRNRYAKENAINMQRLRGTIAGFSRAALVSVGTAAFKAAVETSWQDSGRAAHNVRMVAGEGGVDFSADLGRPEGAVGNWGEQRSETGGESEVIDERFSTYGVKSQNFPATSQYLVNTVGDPAETRTFFGFQLGQAGAKVKTVTIYSPIGDDYGTYSDRAYASPKRAVTVAEAMKLAVHFQTERLRAELNKGAKTRAQIQAFLEKYK